MCIVDSKLSRNHKIVKWSVGYKFQESLGFHLRMDFGFLGFAHGCLRSDNGM